MKTTKQITEKDCAFIESSLEFITQLVIDTKDIGCGYRRKDRRNDKINSYLWGNEDKFDNIKLCKNALVDCLKKTLKERRLS
jgi:hypothetical protein